MTKPLVCADFRPQPHAHRTNFDNVWRTHPHTFSKKSLKKVFIKFVLILKILWGKKMKNVLRKLPHAHIQSTFHTQVQKYRRTRTKGLHSPD